MTSSVSSFVLCAIEGMRLADTIDSAQYLHPLNGSTASIPRPCFPRSNNPFTTSSFNDQQHAYVLFPSRARAHVHHPSPLHVRHPTPPSLPSYDLCDPSHASQAQSPRSGPKTLISDLRVSHRKDRDDGRRGRGSRTTRSNH